MYVYVINGHAGQDPIDWRYRFHIFLAYFLGLCKGISPQNMAKNMVQYLHFRILKFPLIYPLVICYIAMGNEGP